MNHVAIKACGMVTGVGFDAPSSCAAMRVAIDGFAETQFLYEGKFIQGCSVPFDDAICGRDRLLRMATMSTQECLTAAGAMAKSDIPIFLCLAEPTRPGRLEDLDESFLLDLRQSLGLGPSPIDTMKPIQNGHIGGTHAVLEASQVIAQRRSHCIVVGVDSFLRTETLNYYHERRRLLTEKTTNGFIPGEAAAAVLLGPPAKEELVCLGIGFGREKAHVDSEEPLRADGLSQAIKAAFDDAGSSYSAVDYRITDISGEHYGFKEAALGLLRTMRVRKSEFDLWHPGDCVGEVGAAIVPLILGVSLTAAKKGYAPGPGVLSHLGNDDGERAAMVLRYQKEVKN